MVVLEDIRVLIASRELLAVGTFVRFAIVKDKTRVVRTDIQFIFMVVLREACISFCETSSLLDCKSG